MDAAPHLLVNRRAPTQLRAPPRRYTQRDLHPHRTRRPGLPRRAPRARRARPASAGPPRPRPAPLRDRRRRRRHAPAEPGRVRVHARPSRPTLVRARARRLVGRRGGHRRGRARGGARGGGRHRARRGRRARPALPPRAPGALRSRVLAQGGRAGRARAGRDAADGAAASSSATRCWRRSRAATVVIEAGLASGARGPRPRRRAGSGGRSASCRTRRGSERGAGLRARARARRASADLLGRGTSSPRSAARPLPSPAPGRGATGARARRLAPRRRRSGSACPSRRVPPASPGPDRRSARRAGPPRRRCSRPCGVAPVTWTRSASAPGCPGRRPRGALDVDFAGRSSRGARRVLPAGLPFPFVIAVEIRRSCTLPAARRTTELGRRRVGAPPPVGSFCLHVSRRLPGGGLSSRPGRRIARPPSARPRGPLAAAAPVPRPMLVARRRW